MKKTVSNLQEFLLKKRKYFSDVLSSSDLGRIEDALGYLRQVRELPAEEATPKLEAFEKSYADLLGTRSYRSWRENVEVIFVALVIALGIRAYFLQPFKIPTHSMRPTLYGVLKEDRKGDKPSPLIQIRDFLFLGKAYHRLEVEEAGIFRGVREVQPFGILPVRRVDFQIGSRTYQVWTDLKTLAEVGYQFELGRPVAKGEVLVNFFTQTGDHLFVNKMAYHFSLPKKGDVMVFTTQGIAGIEAILRSSGIRGSQYYIKRCVGTGGDVLRIEPPYLYVNGEVAKGTPFERIYSMENGYNGYFLGSRYLETTTDTYRVPEDFFWAMGDNSGHSLDSRYWGGVPRKNLVGSALLVYWPLGKRWGWID